MSTDPPEQTGEKHIAVLLMVVMVNGVVMVTKKCPDPESLTAPQDEKVLWS